MELLCEPALLAVGARLPRNSTAHAGGFRSVANAVLDSDLPLSMGWSSDPSRTPGASHRQKLGSVGPPSRAGGATIAFLERDRRYAPRAGDAYGDEATRWHASG
jgi:hypothetical protein